MSMSDRSLPWLEAPRQAFQASPGLRCRVGAERPAMEGDGARENAGKGRLFRGAAALLLLSSVNGQMALVMCGD